MLFHQSALDILEHPSIDVQTAEYRFDIARLGPRVSAAADWAATHPDLDTLRIGCFGASTGAAAAPIAVAERPATIAAVVSRGGRPDLAGDALRRVEAPTLLIVGGHDEPVIELNREAMRQMHAHVELAIVPGATHLFEEPGTLDQVSARAADWFARYLGETSSPHGGRRARVGTGGRRARAWHGPSRAAFQTGWPRPRPVRNLPGDSFRSVEQKRSKRGRPRRKAEFEPLVEVRRPIAGHVAEGAGHRSGRFGENSGRHARALG
jgi:dienelactone hydrolase